MHTARSQLPDKPGFHRSEKQLAALCALPRAGHVVKNPFDFRAGKIRVQLQPGFKGNGFADFVACDGIAYFRSAAALPHNGVINRPSGGFFPNDGRFSLVGYAYGCNGHVCKIKRLRRSHAFRFPNCLRVVLNPARLGIYLLIRILPDGNDFSRFVKNYGA